jgi:sugar/nucleoside kinase (ribokinase family)
MRFDTLIIGQVCLDKNTDFDGTIEHAYGGAALFSGYASAAMGNRSAVLVKRNADSIDLAEAYGRCKPVTILPLDSTESTRMENTYFSADRERRDCRCTTSIDPYRPEELAGLDAAVCHIAGLVHGDIGASVVEAASKIGALALDVQCMLRCVQPDHHMVMRDWAEKQDLLPLVSFLKTDAAEAEVMTGSADRAEAAKQLHAWGAKEVMITHNSEVLVYDGKRFYTAPLKARNLSGRTGRGDTTFACYLGERLHSGIEESLQRAAALVSLKMETPGPFLGGREDMLAYLSEFYS